MRRVASWLGVALVLTCLTAAQLWEHSVGLDYGHNELDLFAYLPAMMSTTLIGLVLTLRLPRNAVGWLLLANGDVLALGALSDAYAGYAFVRGDTEGLGYASILWFTHGWPVIFAGVIAVALVFPTGRPLPGPRWTWTIRLGPLTFLTTMVGGLISHDRLDEPFSSVAPVALGPTWLGASLQGLGLLGMLATLVAGFVALSVRFRRSSGVERLQLKWVALAGALIPLAIVLGTIDGLLHDGDGLLTAASSGLALTALPVSIGVAVLRYRLYDVDRVISGTVLYVLLTALLGAAFVAIVLSGGVTLGRGSPMPTAVATAAVLLAFRPLRSALQTRVDRAFNRRRYDARRDVDAFLADLRAGRVEPEQVGEALALATADSELRVFFWFADQGMHRDEDGRAVEELPGGEHTPVMRGRALLATIVHAPRSPDRRRVLDEVISRSGLAIEVARLRVEVRRQLAEVEDSRSRLVAAAQAERVRLERDLHDGAQQRLVSIGLDLRNLQREVGEGAVRSGLDDAVAGLTGAIADLRDLARGLRPDTLSEGLGAALDELAARSAITTEVDSTSERFAGDIEAAAYFVASEALANAVKHSGASQVHLAAHRTDGVLTLRVSDDGGGGAESVGSGLTGLADRVAAVGGRLRIDSASGGTTVEAVFPCGS